MNEQDLIKELRSQVKPYIGIMHQGTYSNNMIRWELGILKPSTLKCFLEKMGYIKENGQWLKKS